MEKARKNNLKSWIYRGIAILVLLAVAGYVVYRLFPFNSVSLTGNATIVKLYYLNASGTQWSSEDHKITDGSELDMVTQTLNALHAGPTGKNLAKSIPDALNIPHSPSVTLISESDNPGPPNAKTAVIQLDDSYNQLTQSEASVFLASMVWTLTGLDFITNVQFYVGSQELTLPSGAQIGDLNRSNVTIAGSVAPNKIENTAVTLYFGGADGSLVKESRTVGVVTGSLTEKYIVQELINGPDANSGLKKLIPDGVKVNTVYLDSVLCTVDLTGDFLTKLQNQPDQLRLAVLSIVDSLTERQGINRVQIWIDGAIVPASDKYGIDLSQPLDRDDTVIRP